MSLSRYILRGRQERGPFTLNSLKVAFRDAPRLPHQLEEDVTLDVVSPQKAVKLPSVEGWQMGAAAETVINSQVLVSPAAG